MTREAERKRLVELLLSCAEGLDIRDDDLEEQIADYLLDNGIVVPPCKVWDKLYIVADISQKIIEATIIGVWKYDDICSVITDFGTIHTNSIGKTVFLTREEAEKALEEKQNG